MNLNRDDKELIAKGLNHLKVFHQRADTAELKEYDEIQIDDINALAKRLKLDNDYFNYGD